MLTRLTLAAFVMIAVFIGFASTGTDTGAAVAAPEELRSCTTDFDCGPRAMCDALAGACVSGEQLPQSYVSCFYGTCE